MTNENLLPALKEAIESGALSSSDLEMIQKYISVNLADQLISGVKSMSSHMGTISSMKDRLVKRLDDLLSVELESMQDTEAIIGLLEKVSKMEVSVIETVRKIAQGKELLSSFPSLTEEEKSIVRLMQSFKNDDEKKMFIATLKSSLAVSKDDFKE